MRRRAFIRGWAFIGVYTVHFICTIIFIADNLPPTIEATQKEFRVPLGQSVSIMFNVTDPEGSATTLSFIGSISGSASFTLENDVFTWTPQSLTETADLRY